MRLTLCFVLSCTSLLAAQSSNDINKFSVTLERTPCEGFCPWYEVTILRNGTVKYNGTAYVRVKGIRKATIPSIAVDKLIRDLQNEDFFHWENKTYLCVDYPEVRITVTLNEQTHKVVEGCSTPGKVLALAKEIDTISGTKIWVGK